MKTQNKAAYECATITNKQYNYMNNISLTVDTVVDVKEQDLTQSLNNMNKGYLKHCMCSNTIV